MSQGLPKGVARRRKNNVNAALRASGLAPATGPAAGRYDSARFELIPVGELPKTRKKPGQPKVPEVLRHGAVLRLPGGKVLAQRPNLPPSTQPGMSAIHKLLASDSHGLSSEMMRLIHAGDLADDDFGVGFELPEPGPSRHYRRRVAQHANWKDVVLKDIVFRLYLSQKYGQQRDAPEQPQCTCAHRREISITLVDWLGCSSFFVDSCGCSSVVERLLARGYFPCAPKSPSMAFSILLLDFISIHSLNVSPNTTAWADTLETFWARRGTFKRTTGNIRKRLGMALTWYQVLDNRSEEAVTAAIRDPMSLKRPKEDSQDAGGPRKRPRVEGPVAQPGRGGPALGSHDSDDVTRDRGAPAPGGRESLIPATRPDESGAPASDIPGAPRPGVTTQAAAPAGLQSHAKLPAAASPVHTPSGSSHGPLPLEEQGLRRPSARLRGICAACFGGERPVLHKTKSHVIVCLDANFAQKRRKSTHPDAHMEFLGSRFLPQSEVDAMEAELAEARAKPAKRRTAGTSARLDDEILDDCEQSFIAAQEKVTKASKNYYADTGLMALLCRHDRVLWVANMTSPGERQHYALVLIRALARELPKEWNIGLLYDIACQISRSIEKWQLLPDVADRLTFAVSVFHAYGHQWPCQIVFHPRKRDGFGLSDGEGCERFWSSIRHLISCLRVSGSRRRLFILDRQMRALDEWHAWKLGAWLCKRYLAAQRRLAEASNLIKGSQETETELARQWEEQVNAQLAKLPRQSQNAADKVIEKILLALGTIDDLRQEMKDDRKELRKSHKLSATETHKITARIDAAQVAIDETQSKIKTMNESLGTEHCRRLEAMRGNEYLRVRVNARALRAKIRQSLVAHKFEHRKLERAYRHQVLQAKEHSQTKDLVHRRERNISAQVRKFNGYVDQMGLLVRQGKKPPGRLRLPRKLDVKKLFKLDVDDLIWQEDPGLGPQGEKDLPRYLSDGNVQRGISGLLEKRRCQEEIERIEVEVDALGIWCAEEHEALSRALDAQSEHASMRAAVARRLEIHTALCATWARDLTRSAELSRRYARGKPLSSHAESPGLSDATVADADDPDAVSKTEVDSDDASDAYSDVEDEDEPLADWLDEIGDSGGSDADDDGVEDSAILLDPFPSTAQVEDEVQLVSPANIPTESKASAVAARQPSQHVDAPSLSTTDVDVNQPPRKGKQKERVVYRAGRYTCLDDDVARMARRTAWLSGDGLATFVENERLRRNISDVSVVHSEALWDASNYLSSVDHGNMEGVASNRECVVQKLGKLVDARSGKKWLLLGHVEDPPHWTLVEVRWTDRTIRYYDSSAINSGYALDIKKRTEALLRIYEECYASDLDVHTFRWIWEQRARRQFNGYDCGPFVAADAVSLLISDSPSTQIESEMAGWRQVMEETVRGLRRVEPVVKSTGGPAVMVISID